MVIIVAHNDVKLIFFFPENILEGGPQQENTCSSKNSNGETEMVPHVFQVSEPQMSLYFGYGQYDL